MLDNKGAVVARPLRIVYQGAFYHIISRGNERKNVYDSRSDKEKFISYLQSANQRYGALIHAFCLMSNHYHILMETFHKHTSKMFKELGGSFDIGASDVSQASRRIAIKMDKDSGLREKICRIENSLKLSRMKI